MTAFLCVRTPAVVHLMADTAWYDAEGVVRCIGPKILILPAWSTAIVSRGNGAVSRVFVTWVLERCRGFDDMLVAMPDILAQVDESGRRLGKIGMADGWQLFIAGWSEMRGVPVCVFAHSGDLVGKEAGDVFAAGPGITEDVVWSIKPATFDPRTDGVALFEKMRATPDRWADGHIGYGVGGGVTLVSLYPDGSNSEVLHTWPDKIGRPIAGDRRRGKSKRTGVSCRSASASPALLVRSLALQLASDG